jgi:WD40 repeat protein
MAVAYQDGDLVTLDPWTLQQKHAYHLNAHTLAASPDGHTLAAGDSECVISLFAFDGLRLLCRIESLEERIMGLVFASNSLRLFDLRGNTCNVWEPAALIKKNLADDSSSEEADDYLMPASNLSSFRSFEGERAITVMTQAGDSNFVFCGREEGSITVHDISSGRVCGELKFHAQMVDIRHLEWNTQSKVLFSVDASRRCIATRLTLPASTAVTTAAQKQQQQLQLQQFEHILDVRASDTVVQALISPDGTSFLVSTQTGEELHVPGEELYTTTQSTHSQGKARWLPHPTNPEQLLLFSNDSSALHIFSWKDLERETPTQGIAITLPPSLGLAATAITLSDEWHSRPNLATLVQTMAMPNSSKTGFLTLDLSTITDPLSTTSIEIQCTARQLVSSQIKSILGVYRSNLYFMSGRGWVCSISLKNLPGSKAYVRHFFIPSVWQTGGELIARVVSKTSVAMAYRDEVVVLLGFLEFEHKSLFEEGEGEGKEGKGRAVVQVVRAATS